MDLITLSLSKSLTQQWMKVLEKVRAKILKKKKKGWRTSQSKYGRIVLNGDQKFFWVLNVLLSSATLYAQESRIN